MSDFDTGWRSFVMPLLGPPTKRLERVILKGPDDYIFEHVVGDTEETIIIDLEIALAEAQKWVTVPLRSNIQVNPIGKASVHMETLEVKPKYIDSEFWQTVLANADDEWTYSVFVRETDKGREIIEAVAVPKFVQPKSVVVVPPPTIEDHIVLGED